MKIAILGGSFDPPHNGHVLIAQQVKELLGMDQIWLMPLFDKIKQNKVFHKQLSPVADRMSMAQFLENDFIKVSDFEMKNNKNSFTFDTITKLKTAYPNDTFYWIIGSDQLESFQKYYQWQELRECNLIIFPREHMATNLKEQIKRALDLQTIPENVIVLDDKSVQVTEASSRVVRNRVKEGEKINQIVPEKVEAYINEKKLYEH